MAAYLLKGAGTHRRFRPFDLISGLTLCLAVGILIAFSSPAAATEGHEQEVRKLSFRILTQTGQRILSRRARGAALALMKEKDEAAKFPEFRVASLNEGLELAQGMAGKGAGAVDVGVWFNFTGGKVSTDGGNIDSAIDTRVVLGGIDFSFLDRYVVGLSVGGQNADTTDDFVLVGGAATRSMVNTSNATIALYGAGILTEQFFIDAHLGFTNSDTDFQQVQFGGGLNFAGHQDSDAVYLGANVNYIRSYKGFDLGGRLGWTWASNDSDSFIDTTAAIPVTGTTTTQGQISLEANVAYAVGKFNPYGYAVYEYDVVKARRGFTTTRGTSETSRHGVRLGIGFDAEITKDLTASLEANTLLAKKNYEQYDVMFNLRFLF